MKIPESISQPRSSRRKSAETDRKRERTHVCCYHTEKRSPFILPALAAGVISILASAGSALAEVHYVDLNSTNATPPYTNWTTAATNIQDAVDAAVAGDEVVVTNGIYASVWVNKRLNVGSVNGPQFTSVDGHRWSSCVGLTMGASLSGFTLLHGFSQTHGAGVFCSSNDCVVSNCVITDNHVSSFNADVSGGGAYGGTLNRCTLTHNSVSDKAVGESPPYGSSAGGGAAFSTLNNCILRDNSVSATNGYGGRLLPALGGGAFECTMRNCTVSRNTAWGFERYTYAVGGVQQCVLNNTIIYDNFASAPGGTQNNYDSGCTLNNCCTTPQPIYGFGSITNDPLIVDAPDGDLHLQSNSPCINAGNNAYAPAGPDLDGHPRIASGTVDIGAYEFQAPVSQISYAWLQQFGVPINPSTDSADPDGDAVDNYHEWLAATDPTNALSSPAQLTITPSGNSPSEIILSWSTNAIGFMLQSTTNLNSPAWTTNSLAADIIGNKNVVTNLLSVPERFYRLVH